jgi:methionyl-tRNA formyltransferase
MRMEEGLDTGPWCLQTAVAIGEKSAACLTDELASLGASALLAALEALQRDELVWTPQDDSLATYADKLTAADVALRRVRASGPSAPSRLAVDGRRLVILEASRSTADLLPGEAECTRTLDLGMSDGSIRAELVVPEGRSQMAGDAFVRGARLGGACRWSAS